MSNAGEHQRMSAPSRSRFADLVLDNPVFVRAAVPRLLRRRSHEVRGVLLCLPLGLAVLLGLYLRSVADAEVGGIIALVAVWAWAGLTVIVGALGAARSIGEERLQGTWDMLVLSRLGRGAIVIGKVFGPLVPLWYVGLALLPFCLILLYAWPEPIWPQVLLGAYSAATIGGTAAASLGLCCSMLFRTILGAQLATVVGGWVAMSFVPGLVLAPLRIMLLWGWGGATYYVAHGLLTVAPGAAALALLLTRFDRLDRRFRQGPG
ncbi:MAG: hypothetical protein ACE149_13190 [Armatimonadota bacterium]